MTNENKKCVVCNKAYKYCEGCPSKYNITETWRNLFCSEDCRQLYRLYDKIKANQIKDEDAHKELIKLNTEKLEKINEPMRSALLFVYNFKPKNEMPVFEIKPDDARKKRKKKEILK